MEEAGYRVRIVRNEESDLSFSAGLSALASLIAKCICEETSQAGLCITPDLAGKEADLYND